jgi:RHS repeat-associated protein
MAVDTRYVTHSAWTGLTAAQLTYPSGRQVSSGYDALYRRNSISETSGGASIAAWQFFGQRTATVTLGNGVVTSYMNNAQTRSAVQSGQTTPGWGSVSTDQLGYDGAGRLIGKRHFNSSSGSVIVGSTTAYDMSSNKVYERALQAESRSFLYDQYDSMDRLLDYQRGVLASGGGSVDTAISLPGTNAQQTYNLDALGNWSSTEITPEGADDSLEQSRTHNKLNEVTAYGVAPTSTPVLYDQGNNTGTPPQKGNGNIIDDGIRTYQYDALNRLGVVKKKSSGNTIAAYSYDAIGRRTRKVVTNGGITGTVANSTFRYTYDGQQIVEELDGSNSTTRQFVWGQYIDELVQMKTYVSTGSQPLAAGVYYLLSDLLYRSVALTSTPGSGAAAIVEAYDTDAYGNALIYSGPGTDSTWFTDDDVTTDQPACETIFTGRQYDPETQIYFYRARYYHPMLGRFISRDPVSLMPQTNIDLGRGWYTAYSKQLAVYLMAADNPIVLADPLGLSDLSLIYETDPTAVGGYGEPYYAIFAANTGAIVADLKARLKPGDCVKFLTISGHGSPGGGDIDFGTNLLGQFVTAGELAIYNSGKMPTTAAFAALKKTIDDLKVISQFMCNDSHLDFASCHSGEGLLGQQLLSQLQTLFKAKQNIGITLYQGDTAWFDGLYFWQVNTIWWRFSYTSWPVTITGANHPG